MNPPDLPHRQAADLAPLSPGKRLWLLTILVLLPFALVCLPAVLVFQLSGRQGTFASWGKPRREPDVSSLRNSLEQTAQRSLPPPGALDSNPIALTSSPERAAARVEKIQGLATELGGSAVEGLPGADGKHVFIELPAGALDEFTIRIQGGKAPANRAVRNPAAGKDHAEVIIHTGDE